MKDKDKERIKKFIELQNKDSSSTALNDPCTTTSNWVSSTVPIDSNRIEMDIK